MGSSRSWTDDELIHAVAASMSIHNVLITLHLIPAGGNYAQVKRAIARLELSTDHFTGQAWNKGWRGSHGSAKRMKRLSDALTYGSDVQSYKLKKRLFHAGIKQPKCEECGWCEMSVDGRIPVELDHIDGIRHDNRLVNLRVLCPNCHSLKTTHRGMNKRTLLTKQRADGVIGSHERLKIS